MLPPGTVFGRYRVETLAGSGGMGHVYRAYDTVLRRVVALKLIRSDDASPSSQGPARLLREARAAAALNHPNAVAVFDVGEVEGQPFIAMEFLEGTPLRAFVGNPNVDVETKVRWLAAVARALDAAHESGLVHRDVKPENVILCESGAPKVLDFGVARPADRDAGVAPAPQRSQSGSFRTSDDSIVGTPAYMAPEYLTLGVFDARANQYSWGIMAYELLAGKRPARPPVLPVPLNEACPDVPFEVAAVILRALAALPSQRFGRIGEIARALNRSPETTLQGVPPQTTLGSNAATVAARRPVSARRRWPLVAGLGLVALVGAGLALRPRPASPKPASVAAQPTALTNLPDPPTASREALLAYRSAMQASRDGLGAARQRFEQAVRLDPNLGAAHLRLSMEEFWEAPNDARQNFEHAEELRAGLSERDRALLHALEPLMVEQPPNHEESRRRLLAAVTERPGDAELWYQYGHAGTMPGVVEAYQRAVEIDPHYARAFWQLGQAYAYYGRLEEAHATFSRCLDVAHDATDCLWNQIVIDETEGRCAAVADEARRWVAVNPTDALGHFTWAKALYATQSSLDGVVEALHDAEAIDPEPQRARTEAKDAMLVAALRGDFDAVVAHAQAYDTLLAGVAGEWEHTPAATMIVEAYVESGRTALAARAAESFLERRRAWLPPPLREDFALAADATLLMNRTLFADGRIDAAELRRRRDAWIAEWQAASLDIAKPYVWTDGAARYAVTAADALEALGMQGAGAPPPYAPLTLAPAWVGHVYALAGRLDEAMPLLARGAASCQALELPFDQTRAHLWYARALEAKGDSPHACEQYAAIVARWGHAKPRSISADEARSRSTALSCGGSTTHHTR